MNIKMPSPEERRRSIDTIIKAALPEKRTLVGEIKRLFGAVGMKNAFCGVGDAVAAALMVSFGIVLAVSIFTIATVNNYNDGGYFFAPVLFIAPVLYFSMLAFTSWKERMTKTFEVLASCRYNLKYVAAVRVMIVSAMGTVFIPLSTLPFAFKAEYPRIIAAAFCAMLLYSSLTLLLLLISERKALQFAAPLLWLAGWGLPMITLTPFRVERFIANIPSLVIVFSACALLALYLMELRVFIMRTTRRAVPALKI